MNALKTALLLFLPATYFVSPTSFSHVLLFDRTALGHGQLWRLWTCHWVHFSPSHLCWNLLVVLGAGAWLEHLRPGTLVRFIFCAAPAISLILLAGGGNLQIYGGLSGLATGLVVLLGLIQLTRPSENRFLWSLLLFLVVTKTIFEFTSLTPVFSHVGPDIHPAPLAHLAGAGLALIYFLLPRRVLHPRLSAARNIPS